MKIAYVTYRNFRPLDLLGPCEVISRLTDATKQHGRQVVSHAGEATRLR